MNLLGAFYIGVIILGCTVQNVLKKHFNKKVGGECVFTFCAGTVLAALLFFLIKSGFNIPFTPAILPYALGFAAAYFSATVFSFYAIKTGPLSLTSLAVAFSLIIPTGYGLIFDGDEGGILLYCGLSLLLGSIVLINAKRDDAKITPKWLIFVFLALVTNGACSTIQPVQTKVFDGAYDSTFMIISLAAVFVGLAVAAFICERERIPTALRSGAHLMLLCGAANGVVNLFVMLASVVIAKSIMFPVISAGEIILIWIISVFVYKEKLSVMQNVGMVLGVISVVLLNL